PGLSRARARPRMSGAYRIVRYTPEFRERLLELGGELWSQDRETSARYFAWKYVENPWAGATPDVYLALAGNEIVGTRGFYGSRWESGGEAVTLPVADDFYIAPAHRNRGLATRLMREALHDLSNREACVLNLSGSLVTVIGSLAMGWKSSGALEPIGYGRPSRRRRFRDYLGKVRFFWRWSESRWLLAPDERRPFGRLERHGSGGPISV